MSLWPAGRGGKGEGDLCNVYPCTCIVSILIHVYRLIGRIWPVWSVSHCRRRECNSNLLNVLRRMVYGSPP